MRNVGGGGISITNSINVKITRSEISNTGCFGLLISGGDQKNLIYANNVVQNNTITSGSRWTRTYNPGINFQGVGSVFQYNDISDFP